MRTIKFNGQIFPARTFTMTSEETGEVTFTIADETLKKALNKKNTSISKEIDDEIYFYIGSGALSLPHDEICKKHLDIEFEFISEEI